ncbi:MAG: ABC transporter permease [Rikenellaceae bacterium]
MRQVFTNINSVAKYESKLLVRSWFFMIYMAIAALLVLIGGVILDQASSEFKHATSLIPYAAVLALNIIQSLIIIFMSSDYLKRDKQLDTSEVFYVRPLSNAEYLFGKVAGTIKPFLLLDIVVLGAIYVLAKFGFGLDCSLWDYVSYLLIVIIPSLIFFVGASTVCMLIIGNQAVTYILMLGLSWISLSYAGSHAGYIFDMFMTSIPLAKSDVLGISNFSLILSGRLIYITLGVASMTLSVYLFKRLAGSMKLQRIFLMISIALFALAALQISNYTYSAMRPERVAARMIELNNQYSAYPRLEASNYVIGVEQLEQGISTSMNITGTLSKSGSQAVFNLNGGMEVTEVTLDENTPLLFERKEHLIIVDLGGQYSEGDNLMIGFEYHGAIDEDQMYIDIPDKNLLYKSQMFSLLNFDKRVAFNEPDWVVLTPESGWYVRSGVTYSDTDANWRQEYFSEFYLEVIPLEGMVPVSQGTPEVSEDFLYSFSPEEPLRAISLAISKYKRYHTSVGGRDYALYLHESNLDHVAIFEPIADTIHSIIDDVVGDFERDAEIEYSLPRLTIVDVPEQMYNYKRAWSSTQELGQPELLFLPGAGVSPMKDNGMSGYDVTANYLQTVQFNSRGRRGGSQSSDYDIRCDVFRSIARQWNEVDVKSFSYSNSTGLSSEDNSNPHYLSSILFNSRYNITSDSLSWGNQLMEMYYMSFADLITTDASARSVTGMSDLEQVLEMLTKKGCNSYLSDVAYSKYITEILITQGYMLFGEAMSRMGVDEFTLTLKDLIESHEYSNVDMSHFLDSVSVRSGCDVRQNITKVNKPMELPQFQMGGLKTESGYLYGEEIYCTEVVISNITDTKGYVEVQYVTSDGTTYAVVELDGNQTKRVVRHTSAIPQVSVNTMNSGNIPQYVSLGSAQVTNRAMMGMAMGMASSASSSSNFSIGGLTISVGSSSSSSGGGPGGGGPGGGGGGPGGGGGMSGGGDGMSNRGMTTQSVQKAAYITPEGDYPVKNYTWDVKGEIIVDNEQEDLFSLSDAPTSGYLNSWIDQSIDTKMTYKSPTMRTSYKWSLVSGQQFYGTSILSAWQIRNGDGSQYAEWKIPVEKGERYSISFATSTPNEVMRSRTSRPGGGGGPGGGGAPSGAQGGGGNAQGGGGPGGFGQGNQDLSYNFTIDNGDGPDALKHDFLSSSQSSRSTSLMWEWLGDYTAKQDTIVVRLTNKSDIERINADAVKATLINTSNNQRRQE